MSLKIILVSGLLLISAAGCMTNPMTDRPPAPTKPTLEVKVQADGGVCLDKENTRKLGIYIQELERAIQE